MRIIDWAKARLDKAMLTSWERSVGKLSEADIAHIQSLDLNQTTQHLPMHHNFDLVFNQRLAKNYLEVVHTQQHIDQLRLSRMRTWKQLFKAVLVQQIWFWWGILVGLGWKHF